MPVQLLLVGASVTVKCDEQLLERWNKLLALKQEFGNRPVSPTIQNNLAPCKAPPNVPYRSPHIATGRSSQQERHGERQGQCLQSGLRMA